MLHKVGARVWIARILISWGIVAMLTGFVQNVSGIVAARFLRAWPKPATSPELCCT